MIEQSYISFGKDSNVSKLNLFNTVSSQKFARHAKSQNKGIGKAESALDECRDSGKA